MGYKVYPSVRLQSGLYLSGRGVDFGFTGCSVFGPALYPAHKLLVLKLGFQGLFNFFSEEGLLATSGLVRSSPLVEATPLQLLS